MRLTTVPLILFALLLTALQAQAADPVRVSGTPDGPPICWEKSKKLTGAAPALAAQILTELKVPFTIEPVGSWQQVQDKAKSGDIDLIVSAYKNSERAVTMDFSIPYMVSPVVIVVKKGDKFPLSSWNNLKGKKGVANTGESFGEEFDAFIKKELDFTYTPYERAFRLLSEDLADYLIIDLYPAVIYAKLLHAEGKIEILDTPVTRQHFHFAISKKSPLVQHLPAINKKIAELQKQGVIKKMIMDQYKTWTETFNERQRFYARQNTNAAQQQATYDAGARDRGLENLARFAEDNIHYLDGHGIY